MQHHFDSEIAQEYGIDIAVLVNNLDFWLRKNKANNRNIHDQKVWTYNSVSAFCELFPYWSENQIRHILKKMEDEGIIEVGNFNKSTYDRTKWYTFTNAFVKSHTSICDISQMEVVDLPNGFGKSNRPIPDNKPDVKTDSKPDEEPTHSKSKIKLQDGDTVPVNDTTHQQLIQEYGEATILDYYQRINDYVASKGNKKYKDYASTARNWIKSDIDKGKGPRKATEQAMTFGGVSYYPKETEFERAFDKFKKGELDDETT